MRERAQRRGRREEGRGKERKKGREGERKGGGEDGGREREGRAKKEEKKERELTKEEKIWRRIVKKKRKASVKSSEYQMGEKIWGQKNRCTIYALTSCHGVFGEKCC